MTRLFSLLVCLFGLSLVSCELDYKPDTTYHYEYLGYILTGSPEFSNDHAGYTFNFSFHLHCIESTTVGNMKGKKMIFHIKNATINEVAGDTSPIYPDFHKKFDSSMNVNVTRPFNGVSIPDLKIPVEFVWSNEGHIMNLKMGPGDSIESKNLKRGIISMFCGSFGKIPVDHRVGLGVVPWAMANGTEGTCITGYTYRHTGDTSFEMAKIRDLNRCSDLPTRVHTDFRRHVISRCKNPITPDQYRSERIQSDTQTRVQVRRTTKGSFLESGTTHARHALRTPGRERQDLVTFINQYFWFVKTYDKKKPTPDTSKNKDASLRMELPPLPGEIKAEKIFKKKAKGILDEMKANKLTIKFAKLQTTLSELLQRSTAKQIRSVLKWAKSRKIQPNVEAILSAVGTNASIEVIIDIVKTPTIDDVRAARLVVISSISAAKPRLLIDKLKELSSKRIMKTKSRTATLKALWIGLGSLYCQIRTDDNDKELSKEITELAMKWYKEDYSKMMSGETKRITMLMAIGNAGLKGTLNLAKAYMARKYSVQIRLQAIQAVRKLAPLMQREIRQMMYEIYADSNEDNEVRLIAFLIMGRTSPTRYHMAIIAEQLLQEKSQNIRNFVVSYFMKLARSRDPSLCTILMANNARWVLRTLPRRMAVVSKFLSRVFFTRVEGTNFLVVYGSIIYAKDSALPRCIYIAEGFESRERKGQFWGMEFRSIGSQQLLRDILSRYGSLLSAMNIPDLSKLASEGKPKKGKQTGLMFVRSRVFGEDTFMLDGPHSNVIRRMFRLMTGDSSFLLEDIYQQATSIGVPVTVKRAMSGVRAFEMKWKIPMKNKKKTVVEHSVKFSVSLLMQGSMGATIGEAKSMIGIDMMFSLNPSGTSKLKGKHTWTKKTSSVIVKHEHYLMPPGKKHTILEVGTRLYMKSNDGKTAKSNETELNMRALKTSYSNKVGMKFGFPVEYSGSIVSQRGNSKSISYTAIKQKGGIYGAGFEYELADIQPKKDEEEVEEEDEEYDEGENQNKPERVELKKVGKSSLNKGNEFKKWLNPVPPHTLSYPNVANKKFELKLFIFYAGKKKPKTTIGDIKIEITSNPNSKSVNMNMEVKTPVARKKLKVEVIMKAVGAAVYYDPSGPFTITKNTVCRLEIRVTYAGRTLFSIQRTESISNDWVTQWRELLKRPEILSRDYPEIYQCVKDMEQGFRSSPDCIRTFEILQMYNKRTVSVKGPPGVMGNRFTRQRRTFLRNLPSIQKAIKFAEQIFTRVTFDVNNGRVTGNMVFLPKDLESMKIQMLLKRSMRGWPLYMTCGVGLNRQRKSVTVNTFDGNSYTASLSARLFNGNSLIIAQDRRRGEFTVASTYGKTHSTLIHYLFDGKECNISVSYGNGEMTYDISGEGCERGKDKPTYILSEGCNFFYNASHVTIPSLNIKVEVSPCRNIRIRLGLYFHNSLRGICGDMDREPYEKEFLGKSCKKVFKRADDFVNDYIVKNPVKQPTCN